MAKMKTVPRGNKAANDEYFEKTSLRDTSASSQCKRLLQELRKHPVSTFMAREKLNICHPGGRICELRHQGYNIITHWRAARTSEGYTHRIAEYVLLTGKGKRRSAA